MANKTPKTNEGKPIDRKRSLAAKKGAKTRALNRQRSAKRQLQLHHKLIAAEIVFVAVIVAALGIYNMLTAYAASSNTTTITGVGGKCLDNYYNKLQNANPVQLYTCNGTDAQKWVIGDDGSIRNIRGNYCLDVQWGNMNAGTPLQLYQCNGTNAQKFTIAGTAIANTHSTLCVTTGSATTSVGGFRLSMLPCSSPLDATQQWIANTQGLSTVPPVTTPTTPTPPSSTGGSGSTSTAPTGSTSSTSTNSGTSTNSLSGNIAVLPDFFDSEWLSWNDGYDKFPVSWQNYSNVLEIAPDATFIKGQRASGWTGENEINGLICDNGSITGCSRSSRGTRVAVKPGQTVTYSAYVWVSPSTVGAPNGGGFQFFMDVYGANGRIKELQGSNGCDGCGRLNVPYGSTGWTFVQMKFQVASSYKADGALGYGSGSNVTPTGIIPILQLNNWAVPLGYSDQAVAYVRNTVLTVK